MLFKKWLLMTYPGIVLNIQDVSNGLVSNPQSRGFDMD